MRRFKKISLTALNIVIGLGLLSAMLATLLNPQQCPRFVILVMTLPVLIPLGVVMLFVDFLWLRRWTLVMAACVALSLPLAFLLYPVNIPRGEVPERLKDESWTLMTYNITNYQDITGEYPNGRNPGIQYILSENADVVVLQEGHWLTEVPGFHLDREQLDAVHRQYPYVIVGRDITMLSKFPADTVPLSNFPGQLYDSSLLHSKVGCFVLDIYGRRTAIFGVHLKSLGLTPADKTAYEDVTKVEGLVSKTDMNEIEKDVVTKIADANVARATHIEALCSEIEALGYENTIVCGDFNDTPGCYALRKLSALGLREVYPLVGNGYMNTYNKDRLLFQIDHVLFRGCFRPWSMRRGNLRSSDHYPLITVFVRR